MFLNLLRTDAQKHTFLQIVHHVAHADQKLSEQEAKIIEHFAKEMGIEPEPYNAEAFDLKAACEVFDTPTVQRVCLLETMILMFSDTSNIHLQTDLVEKMADYMEVDLVVRNLLRNQAMILAGSIAQCFELMDV